MRRFWESRADENPLYFIDNLLDYGDPDLGRFFENGERSLDEMLDRLGARIDPADEVVEIGCGAGRQTRAIASRAASVRALDISERMLELGRELNPDLDNVTWILGDGTSLAGIPDASADACVSYVVFQHLPDPALTLGYVRETGRVLRPGGWAAFQLSNNESVHHPWRGLGRLRPRERWLALTGRWPKGQHNRAWLGSAVDLDELRRTAEEADLQIERVSGEGTQYCFVLARRRARSG
jgi:SAM-dependent methyltransferase